MVEKRRLAWFILLRVVVVSVFLVSTVILNVREPGSFSDETLSGLFRLILATYLFSTVSLIVLRYTEKFQQSLNYAQIIWDLLLVTLLIIFTGGINSPYPFLYLLSIINASVLLARREAPYTASLCAILYGAVLDFQFYGRLNSLGLSQLPVRQLGAGHVLYSLFVNIFAYYLTAFLTGYLAERARKSEYALQEKEIDYEELERLNSSIVFNLDSGLLTLDIEGKIKVFNPYVSDLTGISQEEAYGSMLSDILPGVTPFGGDHEIVRRGEVEYESPSGSKMILGYKAVPMFDKDVSQVGFIIALQDITKMKTMEADLKRADRLAAIGELSARIAHEIRNPLASISGSVELIVQEEQVSTHDKRLLNIVLRETDRLNELIRDFLVYARPIEPFLIPIKLRQFLFDMTSLLRSDPRFNAVEICNECPEELTIHADRDQCQQIFWNLFVNAAEAMPGGGRVLIEAEIVDGSCTDVCPTSMVRISVADNGKGITQNELQKVFEPFYTTKTSGTGLGLATVYRIVESHAGSIQVSSTPGERTVFNIFLPITQR